MHKKTAICSVIVILLISIMEATVIEPLSGFDSVADVADARCLIFDHYVPDTNGSPNGAHLNHPGRFTGFFDGLNGQPSIGVLVDGSRDQVVFADYYSPLATSDIAGGDFFSDVFPDSGRSVTFTFVDPADSWAKIAVSRVAFELKAVGQGDNVSASFLDVAGNVIQTTGILSDGRYGYAALSAPDGEEVNAIHQLVLTSNGTPPQLWTIGHAGDTTTPDFAFAFSPYVRINEEGVHAAVREEGTTSDEYTIELTGPEPEANVILDLIVSDPDQVQISVDGIETNTLVFTPQDYTRTRTVTLTAVDDTRSEATHYVSISHECFSTDNTYNDLLLSNLRIKITDNDGNCIKVYLLAGQSNAAGSGLTAEFPKQFQHPQYDIEFWNGGRLPGDGVPDYPAWDRSGDTEFRPLEPGTGNYKAGTHSGCELSLGSALRGALPGDNIAIIKYGMSGSALQRGLRPDGAGDWDSDPAPLGSSYDGVRYHVFKYSAVLPALQEIADRGDRYEIAAMFWMQGETDAANQSAANAYEANLDKLIDKVRADFSAPDMKLIIGRIRPVMGAYNAVVRSAIQNVAAADPDVEWIDTDDLAVNPDNVHYSAAGLTAMGERFAAAYLLREPLSGDLEPDGDIDLYDFMAFSRQWLESECGFCSQADLNSDLGVDIDDLSIIIIHWLND